MQFANSQVIARGIICALLSISVAAMVGCAMGSESLNKEDSVTLSAKLIKGKTTKAQVREMFGEPTEMGTKDGREFWTYSSLQTSARTYVPFVGGGTKGKELRIDFDRSGIVIGYDLVETKDRYGANSVVSFAALG